MVPWWSWLWWCDGCLSCRSCCLAEARVGLRMKRVCSRGTSGAWVCYAARSRERRATPRRRSSLKNVLKWSRWRTRRRRQPDGRWQWRCQMDGGRTPSPCACNLSASPFSGEQVAAHPPAARRACSMRSARTQGARAQPACAKAFKEDVAAEAPGRSRSSRCHGHINSQSCHCLDAGCTASTSWFRPSEWSMQRAFHAPPLLLARVMPPLPPSPLPPPPPPSPPS